MAVFLGLLTSQFRHKIFLPSIALDSIAVTAEQLQIFNMVSPPNS